MALVQEKYIRSWISSNFEIVKNKKIYKYELYKMKMKKATKAEQNLYNIIKKDDTKLYNTLKEIYKTEGIGIPLVITCKKVNLVNRASIEQLTGRMYRINQKEACQS